MSLRSLPDTFTDADGTTADFRTLDARYAVNDITIKEYFQVLRVCD